MRMNRDKSSLKCLGGQGIGEVAAKEPQAAISMGTFSLNDFEAVARAAYGFQVLRLFRVLLNFFAQLSYVNVHGTRTDEGSVAPHRIKQLVARKNSARTLRQIMKQPEFRGRSNSWISTHAQRHSCRIDLQFSHGDHIGRERRLTAAQHSLDSCYQLPRTKRLGDVVVGAHFKPQNAVYFTGLGGEKNDGSHREQSSRLPDLPAQVQSVPAGNHDIEQEQRWPFLLRIQQDPMSRRECPYPVARRFQAVADKPGDIYVILNHKDLWTALGSAIHRRFCHLCHEARLHSDC